MLRVKRERLRRGWTQTVLAFHAGVSAAEISRIESGRLRPYPRQLERLSSALDVSGDALLEEAPETGIESTAATVAGAA